MWVDNEGLVARDLESAHMLQEAVEYLAEATKLLVRGKHHDQVGRLMAAAVEAVGNAQERQKDTCVVGVARERKGE